MDLKSLTNKQLHESMKVSVGNEREALRIVLLHVAEVQRRHSYLDYGRSSLFEYLTTDMAYANGCAQRRIDAARLSFDVPDLIDHLDSGELNLGQVTVLKMALRQVEAEKKFISAEQKQEVVAEIVGKSVEESQVIVAQAFGVKVKVQTKIRHQADRRIEFCKEKRVRRILRKHLLQRCLRKDRRYLALLCENSFKNKLAVSL